jgi:endonuclease/exonuclease/phosphatase family metal-dependent hydrolase
MGLVVRLAVPESPTGAVTVVSPHLEDYSGPKWRRTQMMYLLDAIRDTSDPAVLGGDLNTTGKSGRPLTVKRAFYRYLWNYKFWIRGIAFNIIPVPGLGYAFRAANYLKNLHDPTAFHVPVFLPNPSRRLFEQVKSFRFEDGSSFDFSQGRRWSFRRRGSTLADSNQRARKGFTTTFSFARTFGGLVGKYKIDWLFVKNDQTSSTGQRADDFRFTPRFGRTLPVMNEILGRRISDHCPITLTLPIGGTGGENQAQRP